MEEVFKQIANIGFPIVLSMYLLMRIENKMEQLTGSIQQLSIVLSSPKGGSNGERM